MTSIKYESARINFEKEALKEYSNSLTYSINQCRENSKDEFYSSLIDTLKERLKQVKEWRDNLNAQETALQQMVEWERRARTLNKLADSAVLPDDGREIAEAQLRQLKERAYTAQALVDLRM